MCSVVRAFINCTSCVCVEPVKRSTYVELERNGKLFLAPTVCIYIYIERERGGEKRGREGLCQQAMTTLQVQRPAIGALYRNIEGREGGGGQCLV